MKNIPIYTVYEAGRDYNEIDKWGLGHKCVIWSSPSREHAYKSMVEMAKNQEKQGYLVILENPSLNEGPLHFRRNTGDEYIRWVVQEFLTVEDDVNL